MGNKTKHRGYAVQQRTKKALALKNSGATYAEIAEALGVSKSTVCTDIRTAIADITKEEADIQRQIEINRLDRLQRGVWEKALRGDIPAQQQALRIIDRRCRLLGLDLPQRVEVSTADVDLDGAVSRIMALIDMQIQTANEET